MIRPLQTADWPHVQRIYEEGIATGIATFQTEAPTWAEWDASHLPLGRLLAVMEEAPAGWAALSPVSSRCVYAGVAEVSVYVGASFRGRGVGRSHLNALVRESETNGIWTLQSGIFPKNRGSVALHKSCGFRIVGNRERIGQLHGVWCDNLLLERRNKTIGI